MTSISSIHTTILSEPLSCIEVCPWNAESTKCSNIFAVGTYFLHQNNGSDFESELKSPGPQKRTGTIQIFRANKDGSLKHLTTHQCDYAILDLHWEPYTIDRDTVPEYIWTANSTGSMSRHVMSKDASTIDESHVLQFWDIEMLILSFAFHPTKEGLMGLTLSDGSVVMVQVPSQATDATQCALQAVTKHDLEAWTMSFDLQGRKCFSGGDDAVFSSFELGFETPSEASLSNQLQLPLEPRQQFKDRRIHSAGVTAILPLSDFLILTGSYDDHLRLIDTSQKPPKVLHEINLGGGVWRLKRLPVRSTRSSFDICASCMHAGVRIVRVIVPDEQGCGSQMSVVARFEEHESMNYGSDFVWHGDGRYTMLSTSFYDTRLCLWDYSSKPESVEVG